MFEQPSNGSQLSTVQMSPSSQFTVEPAVQSPPEHTSFSVHILPSSQSRVLARYWQPTNGSQLSLVHRLSSTQVILDAPAQAPSLQTSSWVHRSPSSHGDSLFVLAQPVTLSQVSVVQPLSSLQSTLVVSLQAPLAQLSFSVQAFPSSQGRLLCILLQPEPESQLSVVHRLSSLQSTVSGPAHTPAEQISPLVQASPSSQTIEFCTYWQPDAGRQ